VIFQDFPGPGIFKKKNPRLSRRRGNPGQYLSTESTWAWSWPDTNQHEVRSGQTDLCQWECCCHCCYVQWWSRSCHCRMRLPRRRCCHRQRCPAETDRLETSLHYEIAVVSTSLVTLLDELPLSSLKRSYQACRTSTNQWFIWHSSQTIDCHIQIQ